MENHTSLVSIRDQSAARRISTSPTRAISAADDVSGDEDSVFALSLSTVSGSAGGEEDSGVVVNNISEALVKRYASWTVNKNLQSVMPLDAKTSGVFKALGGKDGTHDIIPEQLRGCGENVCDIQLQIIRTERDLPEMAKASLFHYLRNKLS